MLPRGIIASDYCCSHSMQTQPLSASTTTNHGSLFRKKSRTLLASTDAGRASSATEHSGNTSLIKRSASHRLRHVTSPSSDNLAAYSHQADKRSVSSVSTGANAEKALDLLFRPPASPSTIRPSRTSSSLSQGGRRDESNTTAASSYGVVNGTPDCRAVFHHIQAMGSKRMSTMDYLRKA